MLPVAANRSHATDTFPLKKRKEKKSMPLPAKVLLFKRFLNYVATASYLTTMTMLKSTSHRRLPVKVRKGLL